MRFDTVLFDIDGTVLDTGEGITNGVSYAVGKFGLPPLSFETRKRFIGPPLRESFKKYCNADADFAEKLLEAYREYYSTRGMHECKPYEGIRELLDFLYREGYKVYTATAKPVEYTSLMLKEHGRDRYFIEVVGASMDKSLDSKEMIIKAALERAKGNRALMIGDTAYDILGAHKNAIAAVGVLYGYGDNDEILAAKPDFVAQTIDDVYNFI